MRANNWGRVRIDALANLVITVSFAGTGVFPGGIYYIRSYLFIWISNQKEGQAIPSPALKLFLTPPLTRDMTGISPLYGTKSRSNTLAPARGVLYLVLYNLCTMPRQRGQFLLTGSLDDMSFYKDKHHGYLIRRKGGPSKQQIKKKKSMEPVRQNNREFGKASSYGALLRSAFRPLLLHCPEYSMSRRLQSFLLSLIKMDPSRAAGGRELEKEFLPRFQEFELNAPASYRLFFKKGIDITVQKEKITARGRYSLPKALPGSADYYKVVSVLASVEFGRKVFINEVKENELKPCKGSTDIVFEHHLQGTGYLFYGLVICFYKANEGRPELIAEDRMKAGFVSFVG